MTDDEATAQRRMAEFLQSEERDGKVFDEEEADRALIVGYVIVAEWIDQDGGRWLSRLHADGNGRTLPEWQVQGYLHNALHDAGKFLDEDAERREDG